MGLTHVVVRGGRHGDYHLVSYILSGKLRQLILICNVEETIEKTFLRKEDRHPMGIDRVSEGDYGWRMRNSLRKFSIDFVPGAVMDKKFGLPIKLFQHWNQIESVPENSR